MLFLTDTHGTRGKRAAGGGVSHALDSLPAGYTGYWGDMPSAVRDTGGVGIVVSDDFVRRVTGEGGRVTWTPGILQGRIASLSLAGPEGCLDLYVVYLQAGTEAEDRQARIAAMDQLRARLRPRSQAWSLVAGDWNFAPTNADRWCKDTGQYTGRKDARDAAAFKAHFQAPGHELLTELQQEEYTWDGSHA